MQTQIPSFIFCKLRQLFSDNVFTFSFLLITTLYLSADWFMDRYFMPKNISFVVGIVIWGGICIGNWKRKIRLSVDFLFVSFTVFIGYVFVCSLFTSQYIHSVYIVSGWILFVLMRNRKNSTETFNSILAAVGVLSALYGLLQYTGYIETQSYFSVTGSFDNPAGFAASIVLCYPFLLCQTSNGKRKTLKFMACLLLIIVVILSGSRTGILTLCVVTLLFYALRYRKLIHRRRIFFISGGALFLIGLFIGLIYLKPASASGRVLIWKVSAGLCKEHIIQGNGLGSFKADYMPEQAKYLSSSHADESDRILAGNTNHPFNEYLLLLIEQGLIGIALFLLSLIAVFRSNVVFDTPALLTLVSIAIFSCFSYPFKYAFVWFMIIYCLASLNQREVALRTIHFNKPFLLIILFILCFFSIKNIIFECTWKRISLVAEKNNGLLDNELSVFTKLYDEWNGNPYFLYNYASELKNVELYKQSVNIFLHCESYINTYDLQMQLADNYYQMECWEEAERRYKLAQCMCPSRFLPLQGLLRGYVKSDNCILAERIALEIINKRIKIPSYTVSIIREEARNYLRKKNI